MKILVTGAAGFIGFHTAKALIKLGHEVVGIDNLNDYYDPELKLDRLKELNINTDRISTGQVVSYNNFDFIKADIEDSLCIHHICAVYKFDCIVHLAAQVGIRYGLKNPRQYINTNINGFFNVLECCRVHEIKRFYYASSSSVYGVDHNTDHPVSLYGGTKKANEILAYSYSHLHNIQMVGLRFFTVYGEYGRPDMLIWGVTEKILKNKDIEIYNYGMQTRDVTHISDIIQGIMLLFRNPPKEKYTLYDIGKGESIELIKIVQTIIDKLGIIPEIKLLPARKGDVINTLSNTFDLKEQYRYNPKIGYEEGIEKFIRWYKNYI